jgi:hypothetical protein
MEKANKDSAKAEIKLDLSNAQRQLAGGNVREAAANYNRAKGKSYAGRDEDADLKKLEKELNTAQGSNLIMAQNDFSLRNNGQVPVENAPAPVQQRLLYDNSSAEQQWTKLQQAQEIVVARVQPLHVNLPVRGSRHAFTQVLQTEAGKPMTIRLLAASTRSVSWPMRLGTGAAAFLALWGAVAVVLRVTRRQAS